MQYKIRLKRSLIGCKKFQVDTAHSLGLRHIGQETIQPVNAATEGKIKRIPHLLEVTKA